MLTSVKILVLRWPGGCFAEEYHWRDGIGKKLQNHTQFTFGKVPDDNSFGTHEFFRLCELLGCKAYLAGNLGSGTVQELSEWLEYITGDVDTSIVRNYSNPDMIKVACGANAYCCFSKFIRFR